MSMTAYTIHKNRWKYNHLFFMYYRDKCRSVSGNGFDQIDNGIDGILLRRILHCLNVRLTVLIKVRDCFQEDIMIQFLFFQNNTVSLTFERTGVQDLVTTACVCGEWNQKIRFVQCKKFADRIGSGS